MWNKAPSIYPYDTFIKHEIRHHYGGRAGKEERCHSEDFIQRYLDKGFA